MALASFMILGGTTAAAWGWLVAARAARPRSLAGGLVAAVGLAVALAGATRMFVPGFF